MFGGAAAALAWCAGLLVARSQPHNVLGALLGLVGATVAFVAVREVAWLALAEHPGEWATYAPVAAVLHESAWWAAVAVGALLLYFPDGRLPGRRWRLVVPALLVAAALMQFANAYDTGPFRAPLADLERPWGPPPPFARVVHEVGFFGLMVGMLACAASPLARLRGAGRLERVQLKWLVPAGAAVLLNPVLCAVELALWGSTTWFSTTVLVAGLLGIPVAVTVAVLWPEAYDVDKLLVTAAVWVLVSTVLASIYGATSFVVGTLAGRSSAAAAAGAAAACAVALTPVRARLQRSIDRRFYPLRRAALAATEELHRDISAGRARPEQLEGALRTALRDPGLRVGFRIPGTDTFVDAAGQPLAGTTVGGVPVVVDGATTGVLLRGAGPATADVLRQVAAACATLVEVVRLRLELAGAVRSAEASRARLVEVGYEERRRLQRDLHDGAQQRLVSLGMSLRLAQRHLGDGTVDVDGLLDQSVAELGTAVAELRQIAHGLRPSALDDGLPAALAALASALPATLDVDLDVSTEAVPDAVATTAYYVVSEALTNAVKHAGASRIDLSVSREADLVRVRVRDDGCGGARIPSTSTLADRIAALCGTLHVDSPAGHGTTVEAMLPCGS